MTVELRLAYIRNVLDLLKADPEITIPEAEFAELLTDERLAEYQQHRASMLAAIEVPSLLEMSPDAEVYWQKAQHAIRSAKAARTHEGEKAAEKKGEKALEAFSCLEPREQAAFRELTDEEQLRLHHNRVSYNLPMPIRMADSLSRKSAINSAQQTALESLLPPRFTQSEDREWTAREILKKIRKINRD
ncbi:hypothetical protein J2847_005063 [Azospirillum agricola]|uniref:hypothetical protein n=1 Tax=Azospirillum agricola TaxID=1720247 RepID=UPI001AE9319E|nr:hypothetical protein [Azospirillum agricola]MBP2231744.1 hypothetical protein [Azospirillum agricola]